MLKLATVLVAALVLAGSPAVDRSSTATTPDRLAIGGSLCLLMAEQIDHFTRVDPPADLAVGRMSPNAVAIDVTYGSGFAAYPQAQAAFQHAINIWKTQLTSPVAITVQADFSNLGANVLGYAGYTTIARNFTGALFADTYFPGPIANRLAGSAITGNPAITTTFSNAANWYFGTDGATPAGQYDFVSVVLHELGHGLGFAGSTRLSSGIGAWGQGSPSSPYIYDRFLANGSDQALTNIGIFPNNSAALAAQLTSNNLFWSGGQAISANGGVKPRLYAPTTWSSGSSIDHLDDATYPAGSANSLMTHALGRAEAIHSPGPITRGMFADSGWALDAGAAGTSVRRNRSSLVFGATNTGGTLSNATATQAVALTFAGGTSTWIARTTTPWLQIGGGDGSGNGQFTVSVISAAGLPASGTMTGSVTITAGAATPLHTTVPVTLTLIAGATTNAAPFGAFDLPAAGASVAGSIAVTGWALDDAEVSRVEIWRDRAAGETTPVYAGGGPGLGKIYVADAVFVSGARPDVEAAHATTPLAYRAGWGYLLLTQGLFNQGNGAFTLYAFAYDRQGRSTTLGSKAITVGNATASQPFGSIDTPAFGQTVSGAFYNFGWALTPNTQSCMIGASGVQVSIDSGPLQPVSYGDLRSDIAAAFPGFTNGGGAGGAFHIDTSTLTNGTHQIGWYVVDSCGRADGIGSRFFTVQNGGALAPGAAQSLAAPALAVAAHAVGNATDQPIEVRRNAGTASIEPSPSGTRVVAIAPGERVELWLPEATAPYAGYQLVNGKRRALPLGSSFDAGGGVFYWQPAAGFLGSYQLEFVGADTLIRVTAVVGTSVQAVIDTPSQASGGGTPFLGVPVGQSFTIAGWAVDLAATSGTGVDTVHVWAHPQSGGAPIFLGVAEYGGYRPDIAALYGEQYGRSSYTLVTRPIPKGTYDLVVYPHSAVLGGFSARVVRVHVE